MKLNREQQAMVEANMPLVGFTINKYLKSANMDYDDMTSVGYIALCKAAQKYNPKSGYKFCTYAAMAIVNNIHKELLPMKRKKRGADYVTVSYDRVLELAKENKVRESILGYEPDFSNEVIDRVLCEPVWKLCPTHKMLYDSPLTANQVGKMEGVTVQALFARRKKEFEKARRYLKRIGIKDAI
jgi:RNA polymerase sigma factor (sigma-70 family)